MCWAHKDGPSTATFCGCDCCLPTLQSYGIISRSDVCECCCVLPIDSVLAVTKPQRLTVQVVQAVDETQEPIADIPVREPPPPPRPTRPYFHASTHYFLTERQGVRRLVSGPMTVAFHALNKRDAHRESKRISASIRESFNIMSQRGMFTMQLQVCCCTTVYRLCHNRFYVLSCLTVHVMQSM